MSGEQVKKKLEQLGVSQAKLAEGLGYSRHRLTNALASPNIKTGLLEDIARYLGKKIGWFYDEYLPPQEWTDISHIRSFVNDSYLTFMIGIKNVEKNKEKE